VQYGKTEQSQNGGCIATSSAMLHFPLGLNTSGTADLFHRNRRWIVGDPDIENGERPSTQSRPEPSAPLFRNQTYRALTK
jgi:hypothetical protein